jgi:L-amino acid N-acyltransferase YncA
MSVPRIRLARPTDAGGVHAIYAPVVRDTAISFEYEEPSVAEMARRISGVLSSGYPWIVSDDAGEIAGYAYASSFRTRRAYDWTTEVSVYVHPDHHRRGLGRALYAKLFEILTLQGYRSAYGVATAPNAGSEGLHRAMGFELVGRFPRVGFKFDRWHDVICWHRALGPEDDRPGEIRSLSEVLGEAGLGDVS